MHVAREVRHTELLFRERLRLLCVETGADSASTSGSSKASIRVSTIMANSLLFFPAGRDDVTVIP
jgi:hypothetical protein